MRLTQTEENYLKTIFTLTEGDKSTTSTNEIAKSLETSASSVTDMYKKLVEKKLIIYKKYRPIELSKLGRKTATSLIRKHRLWEIYLSKYFQLDADHLHDDAEGIEHVITLEIEKELIRLLERPETDPHHSKIPY